MKINQVVCSFQGLDRVLVLLFVSISFIFKKRMLLKKDGIVFLVCLILLTSRRLDCRFNNWIFVILE